MSIQRKLIITPCFTQCNLSGFLSIKEPKRELLLWFVSVCDCFVSEWNYEIVCQAMSILQYFSVENRDIGRQAEEITLPSREEAGVSSTEYDNIVAEVEIVSNKRRRITYHERGKVKLAKYICQYVWCSNRKQILPT